MLVDWTRDFDHWYTRLEAEVEQGDVEARMLLALVDAELAFLMDLDDAPADDTPTLKRVRQSRGYPVWRVAHPFREKFAVRIIVWFPHGGRAVVALFGANKARMGDVFYDSVGTRADQAIDTYLRRTSPEGGQP